MTGKAIQQLQSRLSTLSANDPAHVAVAYLLDVATRMQAQGMSQRDLALRLGTSAAYTTRLFQFSGNLSLRTMVRLAEATGARVNVGLEDTPDDSASDPT